MHNQCSTVLVPPTPSPSREECNWKLLSKGAAGKGKWHSKRRQQVTQFYDSVILQGSIPVKTVFIKTENFQDN